MIHGILQKIFDILETLYLLSIPNMHKELLDGMNEPYSETIPEEQVNW